MGEFEEKLGAILSNPQAMSQIMSIANSLGESEPTDASHISAANAENDTANTSGLNSFEADSLNMIGALMNIYNQNDDQKVALLNALKPFVKEKRYSKVDKAIQIARLTNVAKTALEIFRAKEGDDV